MMQKFIFEHGKNPWNFLPVDEVKAHIAEITTGKVRAYLAEIDSECVGFACFYLGLPLLCQKFAHIWGQSETMKANFRV